MAGPGTSTNAQGTSIATNTSFIVAPDGTALLLWYDGTNQKYSYASAPYTSWTTATYTTGARFAAAAVQLASGNVHSATNLTSGPETYFLFTKSGATYTLGAGNQIVGTASALNPGGPTCYMRDGFGRDWVITNTNSTTAVRSYYSSNPGGVSSWTSSLALTAQGSDAGAPAADVAGNFVVVCYVNASNVATYQRIDGSGSGLGSWSTAAAITNCTGDNTATYCFRGNDTTKGALIYNMAGIQAQIYDATADSWSTVTTLDSATNSRSATLVAAGDDIYCVWCQYAAANSYALVYKKWTLATATWDASPTTIVASGTNINFPQADYSNSTLVVAYTVGTVSPWTVSVVAIATSTLSAQRTIGQTVALLQSAARTISTTGCLEVSGTRTIGGSVSLSQVLVSSISTSTSGYATAYSADNNVVIAADGTACVFWYDGTNINFSSAVPPYTSWSTTLFVTSTLGNTLSAIDDTGDNIVVIGAITPPDAYALTKSGGAWSAGVGVQVTTNNISNGQTFQALKDIRGRYWAVMNGGSNTALRAYYTTTPTVANWTNSLTQTGLATDTNMPVSALVGNYLVVVYMTAAPTVTYQRADVSGSSVGSWSTATAVPNMFGSPGTGVAFAFEGNANGTATLAYATVSGVYAQTYTAATDSWSVATQLSSNAADNKPTLVSIGSDSLAFWLSFVGIANNALVYKRCTAGVWDTIATTVVPGGTNINNANAGFGANTIGISYATGGASPYSVNFVALILGGDRQILASVSLTYSATRTIPATSTLGSSGARTILGTAALFKTAARVMPGSSALLSTRSRTISNTGAVLQTSARMVTLTGSLNNVIGRVIPITVALLGTGSRTFGNTADLFIPNQSRQISTTVALSGPAARTIPQSGALGTSPVRTLPTSGALLQTGSRVISNTSAILLTTQRSVPGTVGLLQVRSRTVSGTTALVFTAQRTFSTSVAILQTGSRSISGTGALLALSARTMLATVALLAQRTIGTTTALLQTRNRTMPATVSLLATGISSRLIPATVAVGQTNQRTIPSTVALQMLGVVRTMSTSVAVLQSVQRTVGTSAAILQTGSRSVSATVTVLQPITRTLSASSAILQTFARMVGSSAAMLQSGSRSIPHTVALLQTVVRNITASGAVVQIRGRIISTSATVSGGSRSVPATVAMLQAGTRTVVASSAVLSTGVRAVSASGAMLRTAARMITLSGAVGITASRTFPTTTAMTLSGTRVIPDTVAVVATRTRTIPGTVAIALTSSRSMVESAALLETQRRSVGASSALLQSAGRALTLSAPLLSTGGRQAPAYVALLATLTRTIPDAGAVLSTTARVIGVTVHLEISGENQPRTLPASTALLQTTRRMVLCSVILLAANAMVLVRSGKSDARMRSGSASVQARGGTADVRTNS